MKTLLIAIVLFSTTIWAKETDSKNREKLIYIMPGDRAWEIVDQCTRSYYYPDTFWRMTEDQVTAIEKLLRKEIDRLTQLKADFVPEDLDQYKRQYIGFEMNDQSYFYGNFFPKNFELEVDPMREAVIVCRGDKRFWGMLFNIDKFAFEAIERNDKMLKPKGAFDPKALDQPQQ